MSNKRPGRINIAADQLTANVLVLNGQRFTREDLQKPLAQEVLVRPEPPAAPAVASNGPCCADRIADLETALQKTRSAIETNISLQRTAVKRKGHYYVSGRRINASDLQSASGRYFTVTHHTSVKEAVQRLAEEIDCLYGAQLVSSDEISSSQSN